MKPDDILSTVARIGTPEKPVYLVGGAVRDRLLGRVIHDYDFTLTGDTRAAARKVADQLGGAFYALDEERGTYRVILSNTYGETDSLDFASLRFETLIDDLRSRDFTINAMALDLADPERVIDPLGGVQDIQKRILRACSPTSLSDDPVRSLRAVRMELSLRLQVDLDTRAQIIQASGLLERISPERLRDELFRILDTEQVEQGLFRLDDYGLLLALLPDLKGLKGLRQSPPHIFPGWEHTFAVVRELEFVWGYFVKGEVDQFQREELMAPVSVSLGRFQGPIASHYAKPFLPLRSLHALLVFAALYHDCAKPLTGTIDPDGRIHFFNHDEIGAGIAAQRARVLTLSGLEVERIETIIKGHMRIHHLVDAPQDPSPRAIYRYFRATQQAGIDICLLSLADTLGTYGSTLSMDHWRRVIHIVAILMEAYWNQPEKLVAPPRLIGGRDLILELGLKPGPMIGRILEAVREAQVGGEVTNRVEALTLAQQILNEV